MHTAEGLRPGTLSCPAERLILELAAIVEGEVQELRLGSVARHNVR